MNRWVATAGMSLIELLIACVCFSFVLGGAYRAMSLFGKQSTADLSRVALQSSMESYLATLSRQFSARLQPGPGDPPGYELRNSAGFSPTGLGACQDLLIRRRLGAAIGSTLYSTACGQSIATSSNLPTLAATSACMGSNGARVSSVTESRFTYPADQPGAAPSRAVTTTFDKAEIAVSLCFRVDNPVAPTAINAELSGIFRGNGKADFISVRQIFPLNAHSAGVEQLPN